MASNADRKLQDELEKRAKLQAEINSGLEGYLKGLEKVRDLNKALRKYDIDRGKLIAEETQLEAEILRLGAANAVNEQRRLDIIKAELRILDKIEKKLKKERDTYAEIVKEAKLLKMTLTEAGVATAKGLAKTIGNLPSIIANSTSRLKDLFDMDKSIKMSALQMGVLSKQSVSFRNNIIDASFETNALGVGVQQLAEMQASYSENLGRTVILSKQGLKDMSAMAAATGLGADGAAELAAALESQGLSASRTKDFIEQTLNDSHKMGLNATKVVKNIQQNIKMLNRYSFKNGTKGLGKMAETAAKLGVDMETVGSMSEKLFNLEGAVDMSAQLQVMGGEWAKLADPFKLMYLGREDINTLLEKMGEAAASSFHFDEGEFKISAMEIQRLKQIAEQTGVEYDKLAEAGKNAAKFALVKKQMRFSFDDPEMQKFIENTAVLDKNGKAVIQLESGPKLVNQLNASDKKSLDALMKEKASLEKRAMESQTFDDKLTNLINMVKTAFLPVVEGINSVLGPFVDKLFGPKGDDFKKELRELGVSIGHLVEWGAGFVKGIAEFALMIGPSGVFWTIMGAKGLGMIFDGAKWFAQGLMLAKGFMFGSKGFGMGTYGMGASSSWRPGQQGPPAAAGFSKMAKFGGGALGGLAVGGIDAMNAESTEEGIGNVAGGIVLGGIGALFGGPVGAMIGAQIGSSLGGYIGKNIADDNQRTSINDGIVSFNKNDKFMKVNDSTMIAGTNVNGNKDLAKVLSGGALNGIDSSKYDNKQSIKAPQTPSVSKVEFGELKINGSITLNTPGNPGQGVNLLADEKSKALLIRELSPLIHKEVRRQQGKS
jgi:hypothetical protein